MNPINFSSFSELYQGLNLYILILLSVLNAILLFYASLKFILALQQGGYRYDRYFKWLVSPATPYLSRLMLLSLLGFLFYNVLTISFMPIISNDSITSYIGLTSYLLFTLLYIKTESSVNQKAPLKKTKRLVRLSISFIVVLTITTFLLLVLVNYIAYVTNSPIFSVARNSLICLMPLISPFILFLAYLINQPFESLLRRYYLNVAKRKLLKYDVVRIGITGSYGKTSVKQILTTLLSQRFRVLSTKESYNTPLGVALTVKNLDSTFDVFIAEMGARRKGDIKELAEMVKPSIGVLTGINNQHLESFKAEENILDTKFELFDYIGNKGYGIFNGESVGARELFQRFTGEKFITGEQVEDGFVYATDIEFDGHGTTFTLNVKGEQPIKCNTVLLGKHNVSNICLACAVAYKMGLTITELSEGISRLKSISHRLELVPNNKGIVIIDDSYNANESGIVAAIDVLNCFSGRKIVLTPGLVELGKRENLANFEFGKLLAVNADIVIIAGKHNAEMLLAGLLEGGMDRENIYFEKSMDRGNNTFNKILKAGDVVLFENDLPDNYN